MITEGSCVLADGVFMDGVFHVQAFAHPPAEPREQSLDFLAGVNLFGGETAAEIEPLAIEDGPLQAELERIVVVLSDVALDKPLVRNLALRLARGSAQLSKR